MTGTAVVVALAAMLLFQAAVQQGLGGADRLLQSLQALDALRVLPPRLARVEAYVGLAAHGRVLDDASGALSQQLTGAADVMVRLGRLAAAMPPPQRTLIAQMQADWAAVQTAAWQAVQLDPLEIISQGSGLSETVRQRSGSLRERLAALEQLTEERLQGEVAAAEARRRRVQAAAWRLLISVCLLGIVTGWAVTWPSSRQPVPAAAAIRYAVPAPAAAAEESLERIEEQV